jgi:ATP/maltotriose-dependent transcriptional regulator MalT
MMLLARIAFFMISTRETRSSMIERQFRISEAVAGRNMDTLEHHWRVIRRRTERSRRTLLIQAKHAQVVASTIANADDNPPADSPPPFAELMIPPLITQDFQMIRLMAQGCSNAEVAAAMFLDVNTVKTHIRRVIRDCGVRNRAHLVHRAHQLGLLND